MAEANSVSLSTNFNVNPYYDDFDETKNFHRILFKPGLAVQARELTQLQTILQNQVDRFGSHIFQEGSVVRGCELNYDNEAEFVRLRDSDFEGNETTVSEFEGLNITGNTSGVTAFVVDSKVGLEAAAPDTNVLYVKYTNSGSDKTTKRFAQNEIINAANSSLTANSLNNSTVTGTAIRLTVGEGIIFVKDHFVRVPEQSIIVESFSSTGDHRIGYVIEESIITAEQDSTINDPASGSFNFNAPGADRLKLSATLTRKDYTAGVDNDNFVEIIRLKNAEPEFKADKPVYSQINDYIARRTFEESGNYIVEGLNLRIREHLRQSNNNGVFANGDVNKLSIDVSPGVSYVFGYRNENLTTKHIAIDKGIDFNSVEQLSTTTNYGNYIKVNEVSGGWDINNQGIVSLRNTAMNSVTDGEFSNTSIGGAGAEIGTARVKSLEYSSGSPGAANTIYNLYIYDINMSNGSFDQVRSIYSSSPTAASKADAVLVANSAVLNETRFNFGVFKIPATSLKRIRNEDGNIDTTFQFLKGFNVTVDTNGDFSINTGAADEQYPFGTGTLNATQKLENFDIVFNDSVDGFIRGERIDMTGGTVNIISTTAATFNIGTTLSASTPARVTMKLNKVDGREKAKSYRKDRYVKISAASNPGGTTGPWNLGFSDVHQIEEVRVHTAAFTSATDGTDQTDEFKLDTGQRDNKYDHGKLRLRNRSNLTIGATDHILVKLSYFTHDTSQGVGYFSVDSYPIDDSNTANASAITTQEIPIFTSPVSGKEFDLRDSIDIRPRVTDTATDASTVGSASTDPAAGTSLDVPSGGLHYSPPNESFLTDLEYYLPRVDKIIVDRVGKFRSIRGVSSKSPTAPQDSSDGMTLGEISVAPYPSITPRQGNIIGRMDLASTITPTRIRRYTMRDIGTLDQRLDNLEYYTSLSLLESDAKSFSIPDSNGLDRFKNGILVDNFEGGAVSDVNDEDFSAAIDQQQQELRPEFKPDEVELEYASSLSSNVQISPKNLTLVVDSSVDKFNAGETVTQGGASGKFLYKIGNLVYLEEVSGTFSVGGTITGGSSGDTDDISAIRLTFDGDYITLPYTHDLVISQDLATGTRNIAGLLYTWYGELELSPQEDIWVDTVQAPDVNINRRRQNDIWLEPRTRNVTTTRNVVNTRRVWGGSFGWWNMRNGATQNRRTRSSTTTSVNTQTVNRDVEVNTRSTRDIIGTEIIPFMRSRVINFEATAVKPETRFYAFFDGEDVNEYCRPANSSFSNTDSYGSSLVSDSEGKLYGQFRIPNNNQDRFSTGTASLRLTDSSTDSRATGAFTSFAEEEYTASGLRQTVQDTIITTRTITTTRRRITTNRTRITNISQRLVAGPGGGGGGGGGDPVAQTFRVNDTGNSPEGTSGLFLTKFELYFQTKDDQQPLIVEIREVDPSSGYVTDNIVPFSRVIMPSGWVNVSQDGSAPTPVYFRTPVFLESDTDYAVVLKPGADSPNYTTFIARMGERDLISGARVGINPYTGILFASSNDRVWTPIQEEDLKFNAYFANFNTNQTGSVVFTNANREYLSINSVSNPINEVGESVHGETSLTLTVAPSANVGEFVSGDSSGANGEITNVSGSVVRVKDVTLEPNKYTDIENVTYYFANGQPTGETSTISSLFTPRGRIQFYDDLGDTPLLYLENSTGNFDVGTQIKSQADGETAMIEEIASLNVDLLNPFISRLDLDETETKVSARLAVSPTSRDTSYVNYKEADDNVPSARRFILSKSQENDGLGGDNSVELKIDLNNFNNNRHSPAIDMDKAGLITVENFVNDMANTASETQPDGGDALARYITRTVTLADDQDAEDIRVILDAYRPSGTDVRVYYKILSEGDSEEIADKSWVEMDKASLANSFSDSENLNDFIEYEYEVPAANLTGTNGEIQYTDSDGVTHTGFKYYKIKIVLESVTTTNPPRVRDLRTIALQV